MVWTGGVARAVEKLTCSAVRAARGRGRKASPWGVGTGPLHMGDLPLLVACAPSLPEEQAAASTRSDGVDVELRRLNGHTYREMAQGRVEVDNNAGHACRERAQGKAEVELWLTTMQVTPAGRGHKVGGGAGLLTSTQATQGSQHP